MMTRRRWGVLCLLAAQACAWRPSRAGPDTDVPDETDGTLEDTGDRSPRPTCHALTLPMQEVCGLLGGPFCTLGETLTGAGHQELLGWEPALTQLMPGTSPHPIGLPLHSARYASCVVVRTTAGDLREDSVTFTYDAGGTQVDVASDDQTLRSKRTLDRSCRVARVQEPWVPAASPGPFVFAVPRTRVFGYDAQTRVVARWVDTGADSDDTALEFSYEDLDADGRVDRVEASEHRRLVRRWRLRWTEHGLTRMTQRWFAEDTAGDTAPVDAFTSVVERDSDGAVLSLLDRGGRMQVLRDDRGRVVAMWMPHGGRRLSWDDDVVVAVAWGSAACVGGTAGAVLSCATSMEQLTYDAEGRLASVHTETFPAEGDTDRARVWTRSFSYVCGP